jgi:hypothetical protein
MYNTVHQAQQQHVKNSINRMTMVQKHFNQSINTGTNTIENSPEMTAKGGWWETGRRSRGTNEWNNQMGLPQCGVLKSRKFVL